jgi:hypothetical protein
VHGCDRRPDRQRSPCQRLLALLQRHLPHPPERSAREPSAAHVSRRKTSGVTALIDTARRTIAEHETLVRSDQYRQAFFDALIHAPKSTERLVAARTDELATIRWDTTTVPSSPTDARSPLSILSQKPPPESRAPSPRFAHRSASSRAALRQISRSTLVIVSLRVSADRPALHRPQRPHRYCRTCSRLKHLDFAHKRSPSLSIVALLCHRCAGRDTIPIVSPAIEFSPASMRARPAVAPPPNRATSPKPPDSLVA